MAESTWVPNRLCWRYFVRGTLAVTPCCRGRRPPPWRFSLPIRVGRMLAQPRFVDGYEQVLPTSTIAGRCNNTRSLALTLGPVDSLVEGNGPTSPQVHLKFLSRNSGPPKCPPQQQLRLWARLVSVAAACRGAYSPLTRSLLLLRQLAASSRSLSHPSLFHLSRRRHSLGRRHALLRMSVRSIASPYIWSLCPRPAVWARPV